MKFMKYFIYLTVAICLFLAPAQSFAKDTLVYATTEKIIDMDPANAYDFHTWEIFYNIYQGLLRYPPGKTNLVPRPC